MIEIRYISPFAIDKNIGREYNKVISEQPDDCYIVLRDTDTLPLLTDNWGEQIESIIINNPEYALIGCMTNRLRASTQLYNGQFSNDPDISTHFEIATELYNEYGHTITPVREIAGLCMIFHKSLWEKVKFKERSHFLDKEFCLAVRRKKLKIGLAQGLYLWHSYRWGKPDPKSNTKHLFNNKP